MAYTAIDNDELSWQNYIVYKSGSTKYKANGSASSTNSSGTHSIGYENNRLRVERCAFKTPDTGASKVKLSCRFTRAGATNNSTHKKIYVAISDKADAYLKWGSFTGTSPSQTLKHLTYDENQYYIWELSGLTLRPNKTYYIFFIPVYETTYCYYSFVKTIGQVSTDGTAYQLKIEYYSNYADASFSTPTNAVGADKNVLVKTAYFYSDINYQYGLADYSTSSTGTYLGRTGYTGTGNWGTSTTGGNLCSETFGGTGTAIAQKLGQTLSSDKTIKVYPQWTPNIYTLTINPNGGSLYNGDNITSFTFTTNFAYGKLTFIGNLKTNGNFYSGNTPTKTGYNFNGWTASAGSVRQNTAGDRFYFNGTSSSALTTNSWVYDGNSAGNATITAQWTPKTYTVTFDPNGGTLSSSNTKSVTYDENYGILPTPTRSGYKFLGWFTEVSGGTKITNTTTVNLSNDITLYAHWEPQGFVHIYTDDGWKEAIPYVYNGSSWKQAMGYVYDGSSWKLGI